MNETILTYIKSIPRGTGYVWDPTKPTSGVTKDLVYKNQTILSKDAAWYCCGVGFSTWFETIGVTLDIPVSEMRKAQRFWYCVGTRKGCQDALLAIKKGMFVTLDEAKPGDFLQFWRARGSGHSVIYLSHDKAAGTLTYFSAQRRTNGPGEQTERLETLIELYFVRALNQYYDFDEHRELTEGEKKL